VDGMSMRKGGSFLSSVGTLGDFTFLIRFSLSPKYGLRPKISEN